MPPQESGKKPPRSNRTPDVRGSQSKKATSTWKQHALLVLAVAGFGVFVWDYYPDRNTEVGSQMCLRVAIVLSTLWLAYPQLHQLFQSVSMNVLILVLLVAFVVARNPLILLSIVLICIVLALFKFAIRIFNE